MTKIEITSTIPHNTLIKNYEPRLSKLLFDLSFYENVLVRDVYIFILEYCSALVCRHTSEKLYSLLFMVSLRKLQLFQLS
jgi:hypothetical protein